MTSEIATFLTIMIILMAFTFLKDWKEAIILWGFLISYAFSLIFLRIFYM